MAVIPEGWDVFLPFGRVNELADALGGEGDMQDKFDFLARSGFIRAWPCESLEGLPLDPRNPAHYNQLDTNDLRTLIAVLNNKVSGDGDAGE